TEVMVFPTSVEMPVPKNTDFIEIQFVLQTVKLQNQITTYGKTYFKPPKISSNVLKLSKKKQNLSKYLATIVDKMGLTSKPAPCNLAASFLTCSFPGTIRH